MKSAREMFPDVNFDGDYISVCAYGPILESIGQIVVRVDDNDYQGDSRVLYRDGDKWGILFFGWGSCSGCDALQGCDNAKEIEELRDGLASKVQWFDRDSAIAFFNTKDFETEATYKEAEMLSFKMQSLRALGACNLSEPWGT